MSGCENNKGLAVAIDGPSAVGKSTVSRMLARKLASVYVDTGAMYRSMALALSDAGVNIDDDGALEEFCAACALSFDAGSGTTFINGVDYSDRIRTEEAGALASATSAKPQVRRVLTEFQKSLAQSTSVVMEGRDIGTVVLPNADVKFFLDASDEVRARRRHLELDGSDAARVSEVMKKRDLRDSTRSSAPLVQAPDAVCIDTGTLGINEVLELILNVIKERSKVADTCR